MKYVLALAFSALLSAADPTIVIDHAKVDALFAGKGGAITKGDGYLISAGKRTAAGQVEVHEKETDIFHIIAGEATLVTGGKMTGGKQTKPEQWVGSGIDGGTTHNLKKGDVVTIPAGTPHWFKDVPKSIEYFTVKVLKP